MTKEDAQPLVSICIPTYEGEAYIAEAMYSAIAQTYPKLEIIISDDASKDDTLQIIESYKAKTSIPIHIHHHEPKGIGANWNNTIRNANGVYIKFLFQDDVLEPTCIEKMVEVLEQNTSFGLVACKREFIIEPSFLNADTKQWINIYGDLQKTLELSFNNGLSILDKKLFKSDMFFKSPLNKIGEPSTIMFRKDLINNIGYFRVDLKQVLDYEFCYRVLKIKKIGIIKGKLVRFRLHNMQATIKNKDNDIYRTDHSIYERIIFDHYFWYLNKNMQKFLLRKYNWFVRLFFNSIDVFKSLIPR